MTEAAEASDTSCSPERPPKTTPTRSRVMDKFYWQADEKGPYASLARSQLPAAYSEYASVAARSPPSIWTFLIGLLGAPAAPVGEAAGDVCFLAAIGRPVVLTVAEGIRQVLLVDPRVGGVVGVL